MTLMYKVHKKLKPIMKQMGLLQKGRYYYRINNGIVYSIGFDNPGFDVLAYFFLFPLYIPDNTVSISYGKRLNMQFHDKMPSLVKTATTEEISAWVETVADILDTYVLPFFQQVDSPQKLLDFLAQDLESRKEYFRCPPLNTIKLKMYTLLYLHRKAEAFEAIKEYRAELMQHSNIREHFLKSCQEEADRLEGMITMRDEELDKYFSETIDLMREKHFPK